MIPTPEPSPTIADYVAAAARARRIAAELQRLSIIRPLTMHEAARVLGGLRRLAYYAMKGDL